MNTSKKFYSSRLIFLRWNWLYVPL